MTRTELRAEIRDNIQEASGIDGAIFTDAVLNRHIEREILSLPRKNIYLEESWVTSLDSSTDYSDGITLPTGIRKVESVERNDGTSTNPDWQPISGVDNYNNAIFLPFQVTSSYDIRVKIKKAFEVPTDDVTDVEVPDDKCEVVTWGVTLRCYRIFIGYLRGSQSWDAVTKPGDIAVGVMQGWLRDAKQIYDDLIRDYATTPRPRDIDLVG